MKNIKAAFWVFACMMILGCNNNKPTDETTPPEKEEPPKVDSIPVTQHNHNYDVNVYATVDVSPMDMSYFPVEYYKLNMTRQPTTPLVVRVIYSRPHLNGRKLFTDILKFGEPWRLGANESTEIQFFKEVKIQDKKIKPGRYIMYCIPNEKTWTIVFNSNVDTWGLHPDISKDLFRFDAPVKMVDHQTEYFTIIFDKTDKGANMLVAWDNYEINLPIDFTFE
jgi:hypothetical protein